MGHVVSVLNESSDRIFSQEISSAVGVDPEVLASIYEESINVVTWQRSISDEINRYSQALVDNNPFYNLRAVIKNDGSVDSLASLLPKLTNQLAFIEDIARLMDMYACLFDLEEIGIRIQILDRAMCPRFHTDKLGCRLITTYRGEGTEWLNNTDVDRSNLGTGSIGLSDSESGVFTNEQAIQQVTEGDVVLLKGDGWIGNEGLGSVHRSPSVNTGEKRVVMTMDFA